MVELIYKQLKKDLEQKAIVAADPATTAMVVTKSDFKTYKDQTEQTLKTMKEATAKAQETADNIIQGRTALKGLVVYREDIADSNGIAITENRDSNLAIYKVNQDGSASDVKLLLNNKEVVTKDKIDNLVNTDIVTTSLTLKGSNLTSKIDSAGDTLLINGKLLASLSGEQRFTGVIKTPDISIQNSLRFMNAAGDTDVCLIDYVDDSNNLRFVFLGVPNKVYTLNSSGNPTNDTDLVTKKYISNYVDNKAIKSITYNKQSMSTDPGYSKYTLNADYSITGIIIGIKYEFTNGVSSATQYQTLSSRESVQRDTGVDNGKLRGQVVWNQSNNGEKATVDITIYYI